VTSYFSRLGTIVYDLGPGQKRLVANVLSSVRRKARSLNDDAFIFDYYVISDGDTPEIVADKLYGHSQWWWVVAVVANVVTPAQWPKSSRVLDEQIERLHGTEADQGGFWSDGIGNPVSARVRRSFSDELGNVITYHEGGQGLGAELNGVIFARGEFVTYRQSLQTDNESKRSIPVISPQYLASFVADFNAKMAGG
jgi:hypothetical protein